MKLVLLGTGGYFPTTRRHTACYLLPEVGVVLDAGTGMFRLGEHRQTDRLDIFLSHAHLDHIAGLTYLINLVPREILKRIVVHAEAAKIAAVCEHLFAQDIFPVPPPFRFEPLDGGARSRVTVALDFDGHGAGELLAPMVRRMARKQGPRSYQNLKALLETEPSDKG